MNVADRTENKILDVVVEVISPKLSLINANGEVFEGETDFGGLLYGSCYSSEKVLTNLSALPISFAIRFDENIEAHDDDNDDTTFSLPSERAFSVVPAEGKLAPFASIPLRFTFLPVLPSRSKGFHSKYMAAHGPYRTIVATALIESTEISGMRTSALGVGFSTQLTGRAVMPRISLAPSIANFGECELNDRRDILLALTNECDADASFEISSTPFFKLVPSKGTLRALQTLQIVASFLPSQLGVFRKTLKIVIGGGVKVIDLELLAKAKGVIEKRLVGGVDKLPKDFLPGHKFVEPAAILTSKSQTFQRKQPWDKEEFRMSLSWNEESLEKQSKSFESDRSIDPATLSKQALEKRAKHRDTYHDYLKNSRSQREAKKITIENERGLVEPRLGIPAPPEKLWLLSESADGGKKLSAVTDENRMIVKKFPAISQTQSEIRDCAVELTADDYKQIVASHKVLDFIFYGYIFADVVIIIFFRLLTLES